MARTKQYPNGRRRTKAVIVRFTPDELEQIESDMYFFGVSNREKYLRNRILYGIPALGGGSKCLTT